ERFLIAREVRSHEILERRLVAILSPPELRDLRESALHARTLGLSIFRNELGLKLLHRVVHRIVRLLLCKCGEGHEGHQSGRGEKSSHGGLLSERIVVWKGPSDFPANTPPRLRARARARARSVLNVVHVLVLVLVNGAGVTPVTYVSVSRSMDLPAMDVSDTGRAALCVLPDRSSTRSCGGRALPALDAR